MAHDVFVSYPAEAKPTADAVAAALEANGIRCWMAPRDVRPGSDWSESIVQAIQDSRLMVLVFCEHANKSQHIKREVERAVDANLPIIPMRIEDVAPSKSLSYFISSPHWLDALTPPLERHLQQLVDTVRQIVAAPDSTPDPASPRGGGRATIPYAGSRPTDRGRWTSLGVLLGAIATVLGVGGWLVFQKVYRAAPVAGAPAVATQPTGPATPPAAPVAGNNPAGAIAGDPAAVESGRTRLNYHLDRFISDLEKLDAKVALLAGNGVEVQLPRQTLRVVGYADLSPESAETLAAALSDVPLYSVVGAGAHGDRDRTFVDFGASPDHVAAFRDVVPVLQNTAQRAAEAVREVGALKQIDALRRRYAPALAEIPPDYANATLAVYARGYALMAILAQTSAIGVVGDIAGRNEIAQPRLLLLTTLPRFDLRNYGSGEVQQHHAMAGEMWEESRGQVVKLAELRRELSVAVAQAWGDGIDPQLRPTADDDVQAVALKARQLRAGGRADQAAAAWLVYAVSQQPNDASAVDQAEAALSFLRAAAAVGVPADGGGLLLLGARPDTADWNAGLRDGVVLLAYNGASVTTPDELAAAMNAAPAGQKIRITIAWRDPTDGAWRKRVLLRDGNGPIEATLIPI